LYQNFQSYESNIIEALILGFSVLSLEVTKDSEYETQMYVEMLLTLQPVSAFSEKFFPTSGRLRLACWSKDNFRGIV